MKFSDADYLAASLFKIFYYTPPLTGLHFEYFLYIPCSKQLKSGGDEINYTNILQ